MKPEGQKRTTTGKLGFEFARFYGEPPAVFGRFFAATDRKTGWGF